MNDIEFSLYCFISNAWFGHHGGFSKNLLGIYNTLKLFVIALKCSPNV